MLKIDTKDICIIAILTTILFVQEQILSFIPNVQLTFLLIVVYFKVLGFSKTIIILLIHVILDCLINGTLSPIIMVPMLLGYVGVLITLQMFCKNSKKCLFLALFGILLAIVYVLPFTIVNVLFLGVDIKVYIIADIPFTIIMAMSNFLTILWLYQPLNKLLTSLIKK